MRFLLRYKEDKPNARVILQGFKHRDVVQGKLDTESPTLSRLGKYLIVLLGCIKRWKFGTMDVKSAFLQSDYIHHKVQLYGEPSADMRRLLSEMIGLKEHEVMMMTKPAFGDVRAPRQWNETADHALTKEVGLWKHRLDGCIYLSTRVATKEDAEFEVFEHNGEMLVVDGVFGLHVDDILAAGEGVTKAEDAYQPQGEPKCYAERLYVLLNRFKFGSVDYQDKQMFCGCQITQAMDAGSMTFDLEKYIHQLKPLSIEKSRKATPGEKATPKEQSQLRGLLGGLAWPANQTQPHLAASVSLAQASSANATVGEMLEVNKVLRFAKESSTIPLKIRGHGRLQELRFGAYTDASWSTRPDGSSQGGWLIFVATEEEMSGSKPFPLTVVDWASKKLTRVCRSSLAAEAQTMATAVDQLEWSKTMFALMLWPNQQPNNEEIMKWLGESPMITDARALFDASTSLSPGAKLAERRTAIEIQISVERMQAAGGVLRWCNSHQQLADGMTKASARTKLAYELQRGVHCLRYDPEYTASKKVKSEDKDLEQDALNKAAEEYEVQRRVNEGIYTITDMETEEKEECKICQLRGCSLHVEEGRRYCSKRHYHAAQGQAAKVAKKAAEGGWLLLVKEARLTRSTALSITWSRCMSWSLSVSSSLDAVLFSATTQVDELDGVMVSLLVEHYKKLRWKKTRKKKMRRAFRPTLRMSLKEKNNEELAMQTARCVRFQILRSGCNYTTEKEELKQKTKKESKKEEMKLSWMEPQDALLQAWGFRRHSCATWSPKDTMFFRMRKCKQFEKDLQGTTFVQALRRFSHQTWCGRSSMANQLQWACHHSLKSGMAWAWRLNEPCGGVWMTLYCLDVTSKKLHMTASWRRNRYVLVWLQLQLWMWSCLAEEHEMQLRDFSFLGLCQCILNSAWMSGLLCCSSMSLCCCYVAHAVR